MTSLKDGYYLDDSYTWSRLIASRSTTDTWATMVLFRKSYRLLPPFGRMKHSWTISTVQIVETHRPRVPFGWGLGSNPLKHLSWQATNLLSEVGQSVGRLSTTTSRFLKMLIEVGRKREVLVPWLLTGDCHLQRTKFMLIVSYCLFLDGVGLIQATGITKLDFRETHVYFSIIVPSS